MSVEILQGDCLEVLRTLPDASAHCCVTSPPYWGLRDYGVDGQLGLEATPELYVAKMVEVFAEVRRVLRDDGTLWLNLGDAYAHSGACGGGSPLSNPTDGRKGDQSPRGRKDDRTAQTKTGGTLAPGLKPKDLVGIPWSVAFALRADGWWLRQDIIWHKPNPMPESVTDRCTKAHEYIFLMSKSERYYFNGDAIREPWTCDRDDMREKGIRTGLAYLGSGIDNSIKNGEAGDGQRANGASPDGRNKRSVWTVTTKPYKAAHFATFPPDLITPCVLAGCPEGGTVLDPFLGSGTTAMVAQRNGCNCIELNPEYVKLADKRVQQRTIFTD